MQLMVMGELTIKIQYDSPQSLLTLEQQFNLAVKYGVRKVYIIKRQSQKQNQMVHLMVRQVLKYLQELNLGYKLNILTLNFGSIKQDSLNNVLFKLNNYRYLTQIDLESNRLTDSSVSILSMGKFKFLKKLTLSNNLLTCESIHHLSECHYSYLEYFDVNKNAIGNKGIIYLVKCPWQKLSYLCLAENKITHDGIRALVKGMWPQLKYLDLKGNKIENEGFKYFIDNGWVKLVFLRWDDTGLGFINLNQCSKLPFRQNPLDCLDVQLPSLYGWISAKLCGLLYYKCRLHWL